MTYNGWYVVEPNQIIEAIFVYKGLYIDTKNNIAVSHQVTFQNPHGFPTSDFSKSQKFPNKQIFNIPTVSQQVNIQKK